MALATMHWAYEETSAKLIPRIPHKMKAAAPSDLRIVGVRCRFFMRLTASSNCGFESRISRAEDKYSLTILAMAIAGAGIGRSKMLRNRGAC